MEQNQKRFWMISSCCDKQLSEIIQVTFKALYCPG